MGVEVRRAGPDDVDQSRVLRLEMLADSPRSFTQSLAEAQLWQRDRWYARLLSTLAPDSTLVAAVLDGTWVGQAAGRIYGSYSPPRAYLHELYITPRQRGRGLVERLVGAIEDWASAQGCDALYLDVHREAGAARAAYEQLGYRPTGATPAMVDDRGGRELELAKSLT